ncbi:retron type reverse transcriptase [Anopheles sinensis]|uniref:Retron type reverse transcriptase n=1 Tax=Anopheles sinensis TaxID=74873 RepID=A0A084W1W8_ANOSI|nr:retron type reverse transcriptase [Anopheles sinensis]
MHSFAPSPSETPNAKEPVRGWWKTVATIARWPRDANFCCEKGNAGARWRGIGMPMMPRVGRVCTTRGLFLARQLGVGPLLGRKNGPRVARVRRLPKVSARGGDRKDKPIGTD